MTSENRTSTDSTWSGMVPVDDMALAVTVTGGSGVPVVYLNGQFVTQHYWRRVVADLGPRWRHITYDERARGRKSKTSSDYSFEAAVRDVDAVLAARGVDRVLVVGLTPRMTTEQMADSNIELGRLARKRELGPVLDRISVPVRYVLASGSSFGSKGDQQERIRADLDPVFERKPNITLSAKVASNHGAILRRDFRAVADAVREVAAWTPP